MKAGIVRTPDLTHSAFAQLAKNLVPSEASANHDQILKVGLRRDLAVVRAQPTSRTKAGRPCRWRGRSRNGRSVRQFARCACAAAASYATGIESPAITSLNR